MSSLGGLSLTVYESLLDHGGISRVEDEPSRAIVIFVMGVLAKTVCPTQAMLGKIGLLEELHQGVGRQHLKAWVRAK